MSRSYKNCCVQSVVYSVITYRPCWATRQCTLSVLVSVVIPITKIIEYIAILHSRTPDEATMSDTLMSPYENKYGSILYNYIYERSDDDNNNLMFRSAYRGFLK